ncbi:MAG: hypothetical protein LBS27_08660 [Bifidobacteriaceae bacterium]|jgi:hypothetical protein|nr:hypothetical protein [Bifidobacteriaceae bacterium]
MSGPKGYHLIVLSASELARREFMRTRARSLALRDRLLGQLAVLNGTPAFTIPPEPRGESIEDFQAWETALAAANQQAEALAQDQRSRRRLAFALNPATSAIAPGTALAWGLGKAPAASAGAQDQAHHAGRQPTLTPNADAQHHTRDAVRQPTFVPNAGAPDAAHAAGRQPTLSPTAGTHDPPRDAVRQPALGPNDGGQEQVRGALGQPVFGLNAAVAERINRALGLASRLEDQAAFEALGQRAAELAAAGGAEAQLLVFEAAVADQLKAAAHLRALRDEADRQTLRIAHLAGPEADELRRTAAQAQTAAALEAVRRQADELLDQDRRRADADYATACVQEALADLGYTVDVQPTAVQPVAADRAAATGPAPASLARPLGPAATFDPAATIGPDAALDPTAAFEGAAQTTSLVGQMPVAPETRHVLLAHRADLPGHALHLQVTDRGKLFSRVTALGPSRPETSREAEDITCPDVLGLAEALDARGVKAELSFARLPGEVEIGLAAGAGARPKAAGRMSQRERTASGKTRESAPAESGRRRESGRTASGQREDDEQTLETGDV